MCKYLLLFLFIAFEIVGNLFTIKPPSPAEETPSFYLELQSKIHELSIEKELLKLYSENAEYFPFERFYKRCSIGIHQNLLDSKKNFQPLSIVKIGKWSDRCIVSMASYNKEYPKYIQRIQIGLEQSGFNGYFVYRIGGYPHPSGKEFAYAAVPYAFKIFLMLEAHKLGFSKIVWIDSVLEPLKDPTPLFEFLEKKKIFIYFSPKSPDGWKCILPSTRKELEEITGVDVLAVPHVCAAIFGLDMSTAASSQFIEDYYQMVERGRVFLSYYPEEFVYAALCAKHFPLQWELPFMHLVKNEPKPFSLSPNIFDDSEENIKKAKKDGFFFYRYSH